MSDLCIFLNTRIENSGALAWIGDKGLASFRYLFNGKTIRIQPCTSEQEIEIHHVASFHKRGDRNSSSTNRNLKSSSTGMIKTALSIVFLIPSFILGAAFKGLAYLFRDVREKHGLVKEHLKPVKREIGSVSNLITTTLAAERQSNPKSCSTSAVIVPVNENPAINQNLISSSTVFTVPEGMSCINAFHALWENSKPAAFFMFYPDAEGPQIATVATAEKVAELFKTHTYFDYEGGRMLKMDFARFPTLDARLYDRDFGPGAAQKAIEKYNSIHPSERFDKNDSYKFEELTKR